MKKYVFKSLEVVLVSLFLLAYFAFIVCPFGNKYKFYSENVMPQPNKTWIYFLLTVPAYIGYLVYIALRLRNTKILRCIVYPLLVFVIYIGIFICLSIFGGAILWLAVFTVFVPAAIIPVVFIVGLILDIWQLKKRS